MHLQVAIIPCYERCVLWHEWLACFESLSVCRRFENGNGNGNPLVYHSLQHEIQSVADISVKYRLQLICL